MKKQTAVEYLYESIDNELIDFLERRIDVNELSVAMLKAKTKAKAMEKEQIIKAVLDGYRSHPYMAEQYFNETYGGDK